jgi:hypothetical protein
MATSIMLGEKMNKKYHLTLDLYTRIICANLNKKYSFKLITADQKKLTEYGKQVYEQIYQDCEKALYLILEKNPTLNSIGLEKELTNFSEIYVEFLKKGDIRLKEKRA